MHWSDWVRRRVAVPGAHSATLLFGFALLIGTGVVRAAVVVIEPPVARVSVPSVGWPAVLERPDAASALAPIRDAQRDGDLAAAEQRARQHRARLQNAAIGPDRLDAELALAVILLARKHPDALRQFTLLADQAATHGGLYDPHLLPAKRGQGIAALQRGDNALAEAALVDALQLHRMRLGLFDPDQSEYLTTLLQLATARGDTDTAKSLLQRRMALAQRTFDDGGDAWVASVEEIAESYRRLGDAAAMQAARGTQRRTMEARLGASHPALIPWLIAEAQADLIAARSAEPPRPWDPRPLNRAIAMLRAGEATLTPEERGRHLRHVGDTFWIGSDDRSALRYYRAAAALSPDIAEQLSRPEVIRWPGSEPLLVDGEAEGRLMLKFRVSARGRVTGISLVELTPSADPEGQRRFSAWRRALMSGTVRPAFRGDRMVGHEDIRLYDRFSPAS